MRIRWYFLLAVVCLAAAADTDKEKEEGKEEEKEEAPKPEECAWGEVQFKRNSGNEAVTLTSMTLETCKEACEARKDFDCLSIEYNKANKYCYLQKVNRHTHRLTVTDTNYIYADRNCDQHYPQECQWEKVVGYYVGSTTQVTLASMTVDMCKEQCEEEETFFCRGFDFYKSSMTCYLKLISRYGRALTASTAYEYYERNCYDKFRSCKISKVEDTKWEKPLHGVYMSGSYGLLMSKSTPEECKEGCVQQTSFHCLGFDYDNVNERCYLRLLSEEFGGYLTDSASYDYHKLVSCPESDPITPPAKNCKWLPSVPGYVSGNDKRTLTGITLDQCKKACENEQTFFCASVDYYGASKYCYLQTINRHSVVVTAHASYSYNERKCDTWYPEDCVWEGPYTGRYISGYDYRTLTGMTAETCKEACEEETFFNCHSFDITTTGTCYLTYMDTFRAKLSSSTSYSYYERQCRDEYRNCFEGAKATWKKVRRGRYISGYDFFTIAKTTVDHCKQACVQTKDRSYQCTSFDYNRNTQTCYLQGVNSNQYTLALHGDYDYYELEKCEGKRPTPKPDTEDECYWEGPYKSKYLSGANYKTITNILSDEDCKKECDKEPTCKGVNWYPAAKYCYLKNFDRFTAALAGSASYIYYERKCESFYGYDWYDEDCTWEGPYKNKYISGYDHKTFNTMTIEECKEACEQETDFNCLSFDYYIAYRRCYLSVQSRYGVKLSTSTAYSYYERNCRENFKYCEYDSDAVWAPVKRGFYINAAYTNLAKMENPDECKRACLADRDGHCLAVYYRIADGYCFLLSKTPELGGALVENAAYDYYELIACPKKNSTGVEKPGNCKWVDPLVGKYISGQDKLTLTSMDAEGCKAACEAADSFDCKSFDMYGSTCYLGEANRGTAALSNSASYTYYERDCSPYWTEQCKWQPVRRRKYISGNDHKTLQAVSVEDCREACEKESDWYCVSFDYYLPSERCYLSRYNLLTGTIKLSDHQDYDYYERTCVNNLRDCGPGASAVWDGPIRGWSISGFDQKTHSKTSIEGCQLACLQERSFDCRSFDYDRSSQTCYLQAKNRISGFLTPTPARDYYEIKKCTPPEPTEPPETNIKWIDVMKGYYISGQDKLTLYNYQADECKEECETTKRFNCKSFDFKPAGGVCYLSDRNRHTHVLSASASYYYYEIDIDDTYPDECEWMPVINRFYLGGYKKYIASTTEEECKKYCEEEVTFNCLSVDYYVSNGYCYMNIQNRYYKKLTANVNYIHYERNCHDAYKKCTDESLNRWAPPQKGKYISGNDIKTLAYMTPEECKIACVQQTIFHCRSIEFNRGNNYCYLQAVIESPDTKLLDSTTTDYYLLEKCIAAEPRHKRDVEEVEEEEEEEKVDAGEGCTWLGPINNYYLNGYDKKTITGVKASDCMRLCQAETTFKCISFDYYFATRTCYLQEFDRSTKKLTLSGSRQYYELDCSKDFPENCQWEEVQGKYLSGNDQLTLTGLSVDDCKAACIQECSFHCISFDYYTPSNKCMLQLVNRYTVVLSSHKDYSFYERNCYNDFKTCRPGAEADWDGPIYGVSLKGFANHKTINDLTVEACKAACLQANSFHCRSFRWLRSNHNCYLSAFSSDDHEITDDLNYNYYQLEGCKGELPELEDSDDEECIPEDFYVASCSCSGDPHCLSFDGKWLHFQGACWYTSARDNCANGIPVKKPTWEVIQNNNGNVPTYVRQAQVNLYEYDLEIGMYPGRVTVNGVSVPGSPMNYAGGKVKVTLGSQIIVTVKGGVQVKFQDSYLVVSVLTPMREKVCGICGNFNGNQADDWTIGNSHYCMKKYPGAVPGQITGDLNILGTSWTYKMDTESTCVNNCPNPLPPVGCDVDGTFKAEDHCEILKGLSGPFKTCLGKMSEAQKKEVFDNCVFDACNLDNFEDIVCRHAASLQKICMDQFALKVTWRSADFCPMECDGENREYQACGNPCLPTCGDRAGENCGDLGPCGEGCFCKKGFVFDGKKDCIPENKCGCKLESLGIYINVGDSYKAKDCSVSCTCEEAGAELECEDMECGDNYVCGAKNGEPACLCEPPFVEEDGECKELEFPCEDNEQLQCFTCDTFTDDDCFELGTLKFCDEEEPMCSYQQTKDTDGVVRKTVRGCTKKSDCIADSIGIGILFCEGSAAIGGEMCSRCNYGDTDQEDEDDTPTADCAIPVKPTTPAPEDPCVLPKNVGSGKHKQKMYFYSRGSRKCMTMAFKGTGGNANRFSTKMECEEACGFQPPNNCILPKDAGDGPGKKTKRFYYDSKKNKCKKFKYSGSGGNENNFTSKKACKKECQA